MIETVESNTDSDTEGVSSDVFTVSERLGPGLVVDVQHMSGPSLKIDAGRGGYKLDVFWGTNNENQSNNWVRLGSKPSTYPYENDHDRDVELCIDSTGGVGEYVKILDHSPRMHEVGFNPVALFVEFVPEVGFEVTARWIEEKTGEKRESFAVAPIHDPRNESEQETYYEQLERSCDKREPTDQRFCVDLPNMV